MCIVLTTRVTDKEKSLMLPNESKNAAHLGLVMVKQHQGFAVL